MDRSCGWGKFTHGVHLDNTRVVLSELLAPVTYVIFQVSLNCPTNLYASEMEVCKIYKLGS